MRVQGVGRADRYNRDENTRGGRKRGGHHSPQEQIWERTETGKWAELHTWARDESCGAVDGTAVVTGGSSVVVPLYCPS